MGNLISTYQTSAGTEASMFDKINKEDISISTSSKEKESTTNSKIQDYPQVLGPTYSHDAHRHPRGFWIGKDTEKLYNQFTDHEFAKNLPKFLKEEKCSSVIDIGAGNGLYAQAIANQGIFVNCYDGNPDTQTISKGQCAVLDFSQQINFPCSYDWVLSLKVGKHIPKSYEDTFIQNLHKMNRVGIIINWGGGPSATPNSPHNATYFNHQTDSYIIEKFTKLGYIHDVKSEEKLRNLAADKTLKTRLLVFRKKQRNTTLN